MKTIAIWVLFWAPCPTDMCVETQANALWAFENPSHCEEVAELMSLNDGNTDTILWCETNGAAE
jgi:hypothetical protein